MTTRAEVGWYAHHHGAGHLTRAVAVESRMRSRVTVLSSAPRPASWPAERWVSLPDDADASGPDERAGGVLHWAPLGPSPYAERMEVVAGWIAERRPALVVCDVSVEVTLLARLLAVPVVVTVMAGDRSDRAHQAAYDAATALVAAWPEEAGSGLVTGWDPRWSAKTTFVGAISRFDDEPVVSPRAEGRREVVVLWGSGGPTVPHHDLAAARSATPGWSWTLCSGRSATEVRALLASAAVVVTHGGQNALAEVASSRRPVIVLAQPRPHEEQAHLLQALRRMGLATGVEGWPAPQAWPGLLERALAAGSPDWSRWADGGGAQRYADRVDALAEQWWR